MGPIIHAGRPVAGIEKKTIERKIRLEPSIDIALRLACRSIGISTAEGIRQAIYYWLNLVNKQKG